MATPTTVGPVLNASTDTTSSPSIVVTIPAAAVVGDLIVWATTCERGSVQPVGALPSGNKTTVVSDAGGSVLAREIAWARLGQADVGGSAALTVSTSANRRMSLVAVILHDATDPLFTLGDLLPGTGGVLTITSPSVTPSTADALLMAVFNGASNVEPYVRDYTVSGTGWTKTVEAESSSTSSNAYTVAATRTLTGGAGTSQTGATFTDTQAKVYGWPTTIVVGYKAQGAAPPKLTATTSATASVFAYTPITVTAVVDKGTVALTQLSGPSMTMTRSGNTWTGLAPAAHDAATVVFRLVATDAGVAAAPLDVAVAVLSHTDWTVRGGKVVPFERRVKRGTTLVSAGRIVDVTVVTAPVVTAVTAARADAVVDGWGVNVHHDNAAYADPSAVAAAMTALGARHARLGIVAPGNAAQRALAQALASAGITTLPITDDRGAPTPASRITEVLGNWGGTVIGLEAANEPQRTYGTADAWPQSIASNGATSADSLLGVDETRRQALALWDARNANPDAANLPVLLSSMAVKDKSGWWAKLGDLSGQVTHGNLHLYGGGYSAPKREQGPGLAGYLTEVTASSGAKPVVLTEYGYHDLMTTTGTHKPTPQQVQATYLVRSLLELPRQVTRAYVYELLDEPSKADAEAAFGLYATTSTPKPAAQAVARMLALYADVGEQTFTPAPVRVRVESGPSDLVVDVRVRRDGTHLVALWRDVSIYDPSSQAVTVPADQTVTLTLTEDRAVRVHRPVAGTVTTVTRSATGALTVPVGADVTILVLAP